MLGAVLAHIERHLDRWDQGTFWSTGDGGSVHCLAGWTLVLSGKDLGRILSSPGGYGKALRIAQSVLGLSDAQARLLFRSGSYADFAEFAATVRRVTGLEFAGMAARY